MQQIVFLDRYADLRGDRATEIMTQMGGAVAYLGSIAYLSPSRTPYTLELLAAAIRLANYVEQRFKHALACRRPIEYSPQVQPIILTPGHGSFPSGHATETFISALVLLRLLQASPVPPYNVPADQQRYASELMQLASRVAINRTVAGVHFPVDSSAGELLGLTLGQYFFNRCTAAANYDAYAFDEPFTRGASRRPTMAISIGLRSSRASIRHQRRPLQRCWGRRWAPWGRQAT